MIDDDQTNPEQERHVQPDQPPRRKPPTGHAASQEPLLGNVEAVVPEEEQLERGPDENPLSETVRKGGRG
jgi:hypothetical protein